VCVETRDSFIIDHIDTKREGKSRKVD
jgi:hypothetical protein